MNGKYLILVADIADELENIQRVVKRTQAIFEKAVRTSDDEYLDGVALNLHGFYSGVEHIFENIARVVENSLPTGSNWHFDLLRQMSLNIPQLRPPVIQKETYRCLSEYRRFRHVVRNVYTFNLHGPRLKELAEGVGDCFTAVSKDHFIQFLQQLSADDN
jgi:hypothetical protein